MERSDFPAAGGLIQSKRTYICRHFFQRYMGPLDPLDAVVGFARALAVDPDVPLMDEPFSSLDGINASKMRAELIRTWQETKKTIIFVTHDISEAVYLSNRLLLVTERPTRVFDTMAIDVEYSRDYDDDRLFEVTKQVSRIFLTMEERHDD